MYKDCLVVIAFWLKCLPAFWLSPSTTLFWDDSEEGGSQLDGRGFPVGRQSHQDRHSVLWPTEVQKTELKLAWFSTCLPEKSSFVFHLAPNLCLHLDFSLLIKKS